MSIKELLENTSERGMARGGPEVWSGAREKIESSDRQSQRLFLGAVAAVAITLIAGVALMPVVGGQNSDAVAGRPDTSDGIVEVRPAHGSGGTDHDEVGGAPMTVELPDQQSGLGDQRSQDSGEQPAGHDGESDADHDLDSDAVDSDAVDSDATGQHEVDPSPSTTYTPRPDCALGEKLPLGQADPTTQPEPMGAIWCFDAAAAPGPTRVKADNSWVDDFTTGGQLQSFNDGDLDYRVFNQAGGKPPGEAAHWLNHNHWMVDSTGAFTGGSSMRPNQAFTFENGKFVVEADVASLVPEYGRNHWVEVTVTDAAAPNSIADGLYAYGQFGDNRAIGCRLHSSKSAPTCSHLAPTADEVGPGCSSVGQRVMEISFFQHCGDTTGGGSWATDPAHPGLTGKDFARECAPNQSDIFCRDRFRMELTNNSLTTFVNGFKIFESKNWPSDKQLPASFVDGELYVYFSSWSYRSDGQLVRFHWDRITVNPTGELSHAPSFCLGEAQNTCGDAGH